MNPSTPHYFTYQAVLMAARLAEKIEAIDPDACPPRAHANMMTVMCELEGQLERLEAWFQEREQRGVS